MFNFCKKEWQLCHTQLEEKIEYLIPNFLPREQITMWYSRENQGKTWFSLGVAKYLLDNCNLKMVVYMDMDNGRKGLSDRNIKILLENPSFKFFHRSTIPMSPAEFIIEIAKEAYGTQFKDCVFILDSTRDFVDGDLGNDHKVRALMGIFKDIRESGGTVLLNHHTTKNGKGIDGSGEFAKSLDNLYLLKQHSRILTKLNFKLFVEKERSDIQHSAFSVNTEDLSLMVADDSILNMDKKEEEFVEKIKEILSTGSLSQSLLMEEYGVLEPTQSLY